MARTIEFTWREIDKTIVEFYNAKKKEQNPNLGAIQDLTGAEDYRLKSSGGLNDPPPVTFKIKTDLPEDFEFDVSSDFNTPDDILPGLGKFGRLSNLLSGTSAQILNIFQVPTWDKTNPLSLSIKPIFYTRRNAILDCLLPAWSLTSLTILKYDDTTKTFRTPGVWLGNVGNALTRESTARVKGDKPPDPQAPGQEITPSNPMSENAVQQLKDGLEQFGTSSNFIKIRIPGILKFTGMLKSCRPTFSRQLTESGGPLWVMLDMKIEGAIPASSIELFSELSSLNGAPGSVTEQSSGGAVQNKATTVFS